MMRKAGKEEKWKKSIFKIYNLVWAGLAPEAGPAR